MKIKVYTRRNAIKHIAKTKKCGFAVAAYKLDNMSITNRLQIYRRFKDDPKD